MEKKPFLSLTMEFNFSFNHTELYLVRVVQYPAEDVLFCFIFCSVEWLSSLTGGKAKQEE